MVFSVPYSSDSIFHTTDKLEAKLCHWLFNRDVAMNLLAFDLQVHSTSASVTSWKTLKAPPRPPKQTNNRSYRNFTYNNVARAAISRAVSCQANFLA
jgi:hypothetical protein